MKSEYVRYTHRQQTLYVPTFFKKEFVTKKNNKMT